MNKNKTGLIVWVVTIFSILSVFLFLLSPVVMAENKPVDLEIGIAGDKTVSGITDYIKTIYAFASGIVAGLAAVMIVIGGIQYATAAGNQKGISQAKETITSAIIGLVIVGAGYLILETFGTQFTNLKEPDLGIDKFPSKTCGTPSQERCPEGYNYYDNITACETDCVRYSRSCEQFKYIDSSCFERLSYCCKKEFGTEQDRKCMETGKVIYPLGVCNYDGPCWQVMSKAWCEYMGIPHNHYIKNRDDGNVCSAWVPLPKVWPCTFNMSQCDQKVSEFRDWCLSIGCGRAIFFKDTTEGTKWFCGPVSSGQ